MTFVLSCLPEGVCMDFLANWLDMASFVGLDTATCNITERSLLFIVYKNPVFALNSFQPVFHESFQWLIKRGLKLGVIYIFDYFINTTSFMQQSELSRVVKLVLLPQKDEITRAKLIDLVNSCRNLVSLSVDTGLEFDETVLRQITTQIRNQLQVVTFSVCSPSTSKEDGVSLEEYISSPREKCMIHFEFCVLLKPVFSLLHSCPSCYLMDDTNRTNPSDNDANSFTVQQVAVWMRLCPNLKTIGVRGALVERTSIAQGRVTSKQKYSLKVAISGHTPQISSLLLCKFSAENDTVTELRLWNIDGMNNTLCESLKSSAIGDTLQYLEIAKCTFEPEFVCEQFRSMLQGCKQLHTVVYRWDELVGDTVSAEGDYELQLKTMFSSLGAVTDLTVHCKPWVTMDAIRHWLDSNAQLKRLKTRKSKRVRVQSVLNYIVEGKREVEFVAE